MSRLRIIALWISGRRIAGTHRPANSLSVETSVARSLCSRFIRDLCGESWSSLRADDGHQGRLKWYFRRSICPLFIRTIMDSRVVPLRPTGSSRRSSPRPPVETVTAICLRPQCRAEFQRKLTRGRRQDYCSSECRQLADSERRRSRARLKHYEQSTHLLRTDVLAHDPAGSTSIPTTATSTSATSGCVDMQLARAVGRAEGILAICDRIPDTGNALFAELESLVAAVHQHLYHHADTT
jgi:hypothetical protein